MKVTGTKKLLIILFALMCALTAGAGVMFARSVFNSGAGVAYAKEEDPRVSDEQETSSEAEGAITDAENEAEEEETAEEAYDPRFDEGVIAEIAKLTELDADFVSLYCHVREIDANELLTAIVAAQEELRNNPMAGIGYAIKTPDGEVEGDLPDQKEYEINKIYDDIHSFASDYYSGEITVEENEDYFVAPDDVSSYVNYRYLGWNNSTFKARNAYTYHRSSDGGASWTAESVSFTTYFNTLPTPSFTSTGWVDPVSGDWQNLWDYCGQRTVITLAPGEIFRIRCARTGDSKYYIAGGHVANNTHWYDYLNFSWNAGTSWWIIDGDAPSGTEMLVSNYFPDLSSTANNGTYNGYQCFFTFANSTASWTSQNSLTGNLALQGSKYLYKVFVIERTNPDKPQIVPETGTSGPSGTLQGSKSVYFEGEPVTISMSPDFGAGLVEYAFYKDERCTIPDDDVSLVIRSMHGMEGIGGTDITFRSLVAGKHYIRLRLIQPPASPYLSSTAMKWSDGTNAPVTFMLEIKLQRTSRPQVVYDTGVAANGKSKTVNYTGEEHKVTFTNADKALISWSSNGIIEDSWDADTKTLVLKQTERGTYTINLYITNTAGCVWDDTGTTEIIQFTFYIKEMLIERTLNLADPSVFTLHEGYTGVEHVLEVGPAVYGQLIVIAPGVGLSYLERDIGGGVMQSYIKFSMVDSGSQEIQIRPAKGFIWKDTKDQATITFNIIIDAVAIKFPTLLVEDGCDYTSDLKTKNTVFDPTYGWKGTLVIKDIPKQAINDIGLNTAMEILSWEPSDQWYDDWDRDHPGEPYVIRDIDRTVLTLGATNANTYPVIISITDPNFTWEITTNNNPTFNLFIDKYELYAPTIAGDTRTEIVGDIIKNPALVDAPYSSFVEPDFTTVYADGQKKIEGYTKQVYYNTDPAAGDYTPNTDKYFKLYAGGFTSNNQVTISISKSGLTPTFPYESANIPLLNLQGLNAGNYIIDITPTGNYRWKDGSTSMRTFKFVIIPIVRDSLEMFIEKEPDSNSWEPISTFDGGVTFDGAQHKFRIGNPDNPSQNYDGLQMSFALVDQAYNVISPSAYPDLFSIGQTTVNSVNILEGYAVHAGVYLIRLKLNNENYSWRQGQGIDMYYTFRVTAKTIKNPKLMADECSGGAGQRVEVIDDDDNHFVYGEYNGNEFQMVIGFTLDGLDPAELDIDYNPSGIDNDPDSGDPAFWGNFNAGIDDVGLTRLITKAKIVGTHTLNIKLKNNDYKWSTDSRYYEFQLIIDAAQVEFVNFSYGDPDKAVLIGSDGETYSVDYDPEPDNLHYITVTRADNDFDTTPFESMFTFEITYNKPSYEIKESTYNDDNLVLGFKDANTYYINIFLTHNYMWKKERMRPSTQPVRMTLFVNSKHVDIPLIIDEEEKDELGNQIAFVNNSTLVKETTYDTNTLQSLAINLGNDFRAFEVDTVLTTSYLTADANVNPLKDKKFRYTAKSAGTYVLVIKLTDTNNFDWFGGTSVTYTLTINPRAIDVPDAFFIHNKDLNDPHFDYPLILDGTKGEPVLEDTTSGRFEKKDKYTGELQYIYLFGYAVENSEVNITVTPSNPANAADMGHRDVSVGGDINGHFIYAKYVNVYTITVEFKLSAEFSTPNCNWQSVGTTDVLPRLFYLEIEKKVVDLPYLVADPSQAWAPDLGGFDSLTQKFTYDGAAKGPSVDIGNCLDSSPIKYMEYGKVNGLTDTRLDTTGSHILTFFIINRATVGTEYKLRISLDTDNECWDTTTPDDIADRYVYIVIEKKGIDRPNMVVESDGATYSTTVFTNDTKSFEFDGTNWPSAMKISDVDTDWMRFSNSHQSDRMTSDMISGLVVANILDKNCDTYKVIVTLVDSVNLKWAGTTDDSTPAEFNVVITPKRYDRPFIDDATYPCVYDPADFTAGLVTINPEDFTTTYVYGLIQKFTINKYIDDSSIMTVDISTGKAFDTRVNVNENGAGTLTYGAEGAGVYLVVIKPSLNATWDTGAPGDITFTFTINKREHKAPTLDTSDDVAPPAPSIYSDTDADLVVDTKTLVYNFAKQAITIKDFDKSPTSVMTAVHVAPAGFDFDDNRDGIGVGADQLQYLALKAGTYTVTVKIKEDLVANNCFDDAAKSTSITFTFIIEKQKLAVPVYDTEFLQNASSSTPANETVNAAGNTFTVTYDGTRHADIILNVLSDKYMTFKADDTADKQFNFSGILSTITATNPVDSIYRLTTPTAVDMKPFLGTPLVSGVDKENYIRIDAVEPGTYKLLFNLADKEKDNLIWADGTDTEKTITFIINKVVVSAPAYMTPPNNSKPYTGDDVIFQLRNVFGAESNGMKYTDGVGTIIPTPAYIFETISAAPTVAGEHNEMKVVSLDTVNNVLTVSAVEIGTYTVKISIKEEEKAHVSWTPSSAPVTFTFTITKRSITPTITFGDAKDALGAPSATLDATLAGGAPYSWAKDYTVTAIVTFENVSVKTADDGSGDKVLDLDFPFEIYYVNLADTSDKINIKVPLVEDVIDKLNKAPQTLNVPGASPIQYRTTDYDGFNVWLMPSGEYNVVYKYTLVPKDEGQIDMGSYRVYVDANGGSNSYTFVNNSENFRIEALKAPFDQKLIVLELYHLSNPATVVDTYDLEKVFGTGTTNVWTDMTAADAIELPYLERDDDYGFRIALKDTGTLKAMYGPAPVAPALPDGKNTFDQTINPATTVLEALNRWQVKWTTNGVYTGKPIARYAGNYNFGLTLAALDPLKYSYTTTTFTFYYTIKPVLYDLANLDWNYVWGTDRYIYDGTAKSVEIVGTFPDGLTVGSYVDPDFDRNSQISAKFGTDTTVTTTDNYKTLVKFANSNPNYVTPVYGDPSTYKDTNAARVAAGVDFPWIIVWAIEPKTITDLWLNELNNEGTASAYIPKLTTHGSKVDYTYYKDDGLGGWDEVTSFEHTGTVNFKVVATLKTSSDPTLDYANNYILDVTNSTWPLVNTLLFALGPGEGITIDVVIRDGTADASTLSGGVFDPAPLPSNNVFVYDGNVYGATLTSFFCGVPTTVNDSNIILTYYNVSNKFRPISAPTEPGHYLIKLKLTGLPDDGNDYKLQFTEYYFDIEKATFNLSDIYWRYTHTNSGGVYTEAKYDDINKVWKITRDADEFWNGTDWVCPNIGLPGHIGAATTFVYDGAEHNVELVYGPALSDPTNTDLRITMKSGFVYIDACPEDLETHVITKYKAIATFSFNGKLWNDPVGIVTEMVWEIEKATVLLSDMEWDIPSPFTGFTYTRVNGEEKGFNVLLKNIPTLLTNYISYEFYREMEKDDDPGNFEYKLQTGTTEFSLFTQAGNYRTKFIIKEEFASENTNYKLGPNTLGADPDDLFGKFDWVIATRDIDVPDVTGIWTEFDGKEHNLLTAFDVKADWEEYYDIKVQYKAVGGTTLNEYNGEEFGSEFSAMHAGDYRLLFRIKEGINTDVQTNVRWRTITTDSSLPTFPYEYIVNDYVEGKYIIFSDMHIDQAEMTVDFWNPLDEASTVGLVTSSGLDPATLNQFVDYVFFADNGTIDFSHAYYIDYVIENPGSYAIMVHVAGEYKAGQTPDKGKDTGKGFVYDINDFTNDVVVKAGAVSPAQDLYYRFSTLGAGTLAAPKRIPNLVYIDGYYEAKETGTVEHMFTYEEWQEMMTKQGIVDTSAADFDWEEILGPNPKTESTDPDVINATAEAYRKFYDPYAEGSTYDLEKLIKIASYKAQVAIDVVYGGYPITFHVNGWSGDGLNYWDNPTVYPVVDVDALTNIKFVDYLDIWQGKVDVFNNLDLTHNEVGTYSVTLLLKKGTGDDLCWSYEDTNSDLVIDTTEADRSSVRLVYSISYRTINPYADAVANNLPTYNGSEYDILQYAWDKAFGAGEYDRILTDEYKNYVEITGSTATDVGEYTVYLKIKDEYFNTIRWYIGPENPKGQPGTFKIKWKILPIYVEIPHRDVAAKIVYDGSGHSVFELLEGYNGGNFADDSNLGMLLQVTSISGDRGINATVDENGNPINNVNSYTAVFKLPDSNYAWIEHSPLLTEPKYFPGEPEQSVTWDIYKKVLDFSKLKWGYVDEEGEEHEVEIVDGKAQFQYTIEDGAVVPHELRLIGVPKEIADDIKYVTDGDEGSTRSEISTTPYHTIVYLFDEVNANNYSKGSADPAFETKYGSTTDGDYTIDWVITQRKFNVPQNTEVSFDGTVRELVALFADKEGKKIFGEGWDNYLDVTIEYKPLDADDADYVNYYDMASVDVKLDYSMFNAFYLGDYRVTFSIKSGLNATSNCVVWMNSAEQEVVDQKAVLSITPLELVIDGWDPDAKHDQSYVIDSDEYDALSDEAKEVFAYIIKDAATGEIVAPEDVAGRGAGIYYTIEFVIADGNDYAMDLGIKIVCASGVDNPYEFCTNNYTGDQAGDVKYWLPMLQYTPTTTSTYDGVAKEYTITNWSDYEIAPTGFTTTAVDLTDKTHFIELAGVIGDHPESVTFDATTGVITVGRAGNYTINFRFIPGLNLSWYDSTTYSFDGVTLWNGAVAVTALTTPSLDDLTEKHAQPVYINIDKASVPQITPAQLEYFASLIKDVEFTGYEINLMEREDTKGLFEILKTSYGSLLDFEGFKATAAGEYKLIIKLKDTASSYWDLNIKETIVVNDPSYSEYDASFKLMWIQEGGKWSVEYVKPDGKGGYIKYNGGDYELEIVYVMEKQVTYVLADDLLDDDGRPETASGAKYVVDENGIAIRYSLVGDAYVEDESGIYIAKYRLMADGTIIEFPVLGEGNRALIDIEKTIVKITRDVTSTEPYEIEWRITANKLATPTVNDKITLTYNGKDQSAESILKGFNSTYMEIVEGGVGKNAREYTAKIRIKATDTDHEWADPDEEIDGVKYVYVTWKIEKADIDLSNAQWIFTDGTDVYENGDGMIYTRKDGKAIVYWAELVNIPEALVGSIRYTTNGKVGAYAGTDAGKYKTSFEIVDPDNNFNTITIPDTLANEVTWNIQRRMLEIPSALNSLRFIFDDEPHDLLAMLGVQGDWTEYYTIDVMYAKNFVVYTSYTGHDGNKYESYGAGGYKFVFDIISGINKNKDNPNVVWAKSNGQIEVPIVENVKLSEVEAQPATFKAIAKAPVAQSVEEEVVEEVCKVTETARAEQVKTVETHTATKAPTAVEVVCDELKRLSYGAELQLKSRKYLR